MAHPLFVALGRSPLGRAGLATFSILTLAAVAGGIIPMTCQAGAAFCSGEAPVLAAPEDIVAEAVPEPAARAAPRVVAAAEETPTPDAADFIADTFATLEAGLEAAPPELTTRSVRTVGIGPDGTPADAPLAAPAPLVAEAAQAAPAAGATPEPAASTAAPDAPPAVPDAPPRESSLAYAPGTGDAATVTGQGANVRSKPQMTGSDVLFALRGGAEVTIAAMQRGWARVVDESGRSGWMYSRYLRRQ